MTDQHIVSAEAADLYHRMAAGGHPADSDVGALSELLNLQLVRRGHGAAGYSLEDPAYISARLAADFHAEAARQLKLATAASKAFDTLSAAFGARIEAGADSPALVEHLSGIETINGRLGHVFAGCTESIDVCQPTTRIPANLARVKERDLATLGRGVQMRTLYHADVRAGAGMDGWVREMTAAGAEVRTSDEAFPRLFIIDRRVTVIPGEEPDVARIIHDPGVAVFLTSHLFDLHWDRARPWNAEVALESTPMGIELDARQSRILELLAEGKSTKEIATILGLKPRRMAELMAELKALYGVETPFQLAFRWVSSRAGLI